MVLVWIKRLGTEMSTKLPTECLGLMVFFGGLSCHINLYTMQNIPPLFAEVTGSTSMFLGHMSTCPYGKLPMAIPMICL